MVGVVKVIRARTPHITGMPYLGAGISILMLLVAGCLYRNSGLPTPTPIPELRQNTSISGIDHRVAQGETLYGIARAYKVDMQHLAEVNNLQPPYRLKVNGRLFIPGASEVKKADATSKSPRAEPEVSDFTGKLAWPLNGKVISEFGVRGGIQHNGIEIEAPHGAPIRSAARGRVGYVGAIQGYGNIILIEHADRILTVYAHLKETNVIKGRTVSRGEIIGTIGRSARQDTPSLYFEVRSHSKPRNPRYFLDRQT